MALSYHISKWTHTQLTLRHGMDALFLAVGMAAARDLEEPQVVDVVNAVRPEQEMAKEYLRPGYDWHAEH